MLVETLREAARRFGDAPALVSPDAPPLSFRDLDDGAARLAAGLAAEGVAEGQLVALVLPTCADYVLAYVALARLGAITMGVSPRMSGGEREAIMGKMRPPLVLGPDELARVPRPAGAGDAAPPPVAADPDRPVTVVLTSGTTGVPKGAVFCERQLSAITSMDVGDSWGGGPPQLIGTQLAHIGYMTKLPGHLRRGSCQYLLPRWRAADALRLISGQRMPVVGGVGAQVALMLREPDFDAYDLSAVQLIVAGGGPSPADLVTEAERRFGARYSIRYSSTESGGLGTLTSPHDPDEIRLHTVGRVRAGIDLEIRGEDGRALPAGEIGEICLRSPAAMDRYWDDPAETARVRAGAWLRTGDLGRLDEGLDGTGVLRLAGRRSEMFIRGGYNVHPLEVEAVLLGCPLVRQVAVVPRPDPVMGEVVVAVVVPADPAAPPTVADLRSFAAGALASYKLPEAVRVLDALPLTSQHKVDRRLLAAQETAGTGRAAGSGAGAAEVGHRG